MYIKECCAVQQGRIRRTIIFDLVGPLTHPNFLLAVWESQASAQEGASDLHKLFVKKAKIGFFSSAVEPPKTTTKEKKSWEPSISRIEKKKKKVD